MASIYHLYHDAVNTESDIVVKYSYQEYVSMKTYYAAVQIQKTYRGYRARKTIKRWNSAATAIQKAVRGWLVRYRLPDIMHEYYDQMCFDFYTNSATKIQALWKGHSERKLLCFGDIIKQREDIVAANERMVTLLRERAAERHEMEDLGIVTKIMKVLFDRHHLLRTHQKEGIFSNHQSRELSELDKILQSTRWTDYMNKLRKYYNKYSKHQGEYQYIFDDKKLRKLEDLYRQRDKSRDVRVDVRESNRYTRGNGMNVKLDRTPYERWLTTTGKYTVPITDIVRTEEKSKNICHEDFDLYVLKKFVKEAGVPPYYINFWYEQCKIHNFSE